MATSNNYSLSSYGATATVTIRPIVAAIDAYLYHDGVTAYTNLVSTPSYVSGTSDKINLSKTNLTFTKSSDLYQYDNKPVNITG